MTMTRKHVHGTARLTLTVNGIAYDLRPLDPHPGVARKAWRLTTGDGATYDVATTEYGIECSCGSFIFVRQRRGEACKHGLALKAVGLL
jgi:hypothetical protein